MMTWDGNKAKDNKGIFTEDMFAATLQGQSGITYDLTRLDAHSRARALIGLSTVFDILCCTMAGEMQTGYKSAGYAFVFADKARVRLDTDCYTCTCATFQGRPDIACQHIFWLLDQLHGQFVSFSFPTGVLLSRHGYAPAFPRIERLIDDATLENVAARLNWPCDCSNDEDEGTMSRAQRLRDIITAFSTSSLPEDFRPDPIDDDAIDDEERGRGRKRPPLTPEQCVVQGDFEATVFRLALHNDTIYTSLCRAIPPGARAAIYFDKVAERIRSVLADFDRYCQAGCPSDTGTDASTDFEIRVAKVVAHLRTSVHRIKANIISRSPHGAHGAAKALLTILEEVSSRNTDALKGNIWEGALFHDKDEDERNLYHHLIGKDSEGGSYFALDALEQLPGSALCQFRDRLRGIMNRIEVNRAPRGYILRLGALVRAAEGVDVSVSASE